MIKKAIGSLHEISKVDFAVFEPSGTLIVSTWDEASGLENMIRPFADSEAESQEVRGNYYFKIKEENIPDYILISKGTAEDAYMMGRIAVSNLLNIMSACNDPFDKNSFFQNLLLDNLLAVDIHNRAKKLHIDIEERRLVFVIETKAEADSSAMEILRELFYESGRDYLTEIDEKRLILIKDMGERDGYEQADETARMICDMMDTEGMPGVRVSFGTIVPDIQRVSRSYKEAHMAMEVGRIFYDEKRIHAYNTLGIGRLIYQLPVGLCEMFMNEVFTLDKPDSFDEETVITINKFFENNLNVSETARQMFVHRNTLVYRLEKLQRSTGLDIRSFEDALLFKIAMMVTNYMKYMDSEEIR